MSICIVANTNWAPWQQWDDKKWRACCFTWHVVYSTATSQSLPIPVPDVPFTVHVSTMWTTPLSRCQTLCAVNGHDGCFITCRVTKFFEKTHTLSPTCRQTQTVICTQMHAQMHMQWYKWDFTLRLTLGHEHNHLFVAGCVLFHSTSSLFSWFFFSFLFFFIAMNASSCFSKHAAHMVHINFKRNLRVDCILS